MSPAWSPARIIRRLHLACGELEASGTESRGVAVSATGQALVTLLVAAGCLFLIHYLKYFTAYRAFQHYVCDASGLACQVISPAALGNLAPLAPHAWWAFWHVVGYVLIPVLVIRAVFGQSPRQYNLGRGALRRHAKWYVLLALPILCFALLASFRDDFTATYPFYRLAHRSWLDLATWECLYLLQFLCLEFFFRGFMLEGCRARLGVMAIPVMAMPYLMIHFSKPWLEAAGALPFGLILGFLAMRSRSIWGGVAVHASLALTMDMAALVQAGALPTALLP